MNLKIVLIVSLGFLFNAGCDLCALSPSDSGCIDLGILTCDGLARQNSGDITFTPDVSECGNMKINNVYQVFTDSEEDQAYYIEAANAQNRVRIVLTEEEADNPENGIHITGVTNLDL